MYKIMCTKIAPKYLHLKLKELLVSHSKKKIWIWNIVKNVDTYI